MADKTPAQNGGADDEQATRDPTARRKERLIARNPITRRDFARLSAATVGALAVSGTAGADHTSPKATDLYTFIRQHTDRDYEIPTLVRLSDDAGFDDLEAIAAEQGDPELFETTTDPEIAAYGRIPNAAVGDVVEIDGVESVEYSPGSNPFWRIGNYEHGVFPTGEDRVDYLSYEQMADGLQVLADRHPERLRSYTFGRSPGHHNLLTGETDPQDLWWVEITNDISDEGSFESKEKVVFSLSIHGDEPTGREGGTRFIQRVVNGDEPEIEDVLDEVVIVCVFSNPDGWVARHPHYSEDPEYERENAGEADLNRSFPTVGWIDSEHYPGEPRGANHEDDQPGEIDDDVPERVREHVPDALALAVKLRDYGNVNAIWDLHNKGWGADEFIVALSQNSEQFDHERIHDANEMRRKVGEYIREDFGSIEDNIDVLERAAGSPDADDEDVDDLGLPTKVYDYGTSVDGLGYTTTGGFRSFVGGPEEFGNLGTKGNTIEIPSVNGYDAEAVDLLASTYVSAIRAVTTHATSTVEATIETDGRDTAYITTDALTRSSDDLDLTPIETVRTRAVTTAEADATSEATFDVSEDAGEISVTATPRPPEDDDAADDEGMDDQRFPDVVVSLVDPSGETIETFDGDVGEREGSEWTVSDPDAGEWTVTVENRGDEAGTVTVSVEALEAEGGELGNPDPLTGAGFEQQDYEASPFVYFEDNSDYLDDGSMEPVTPAEVADGALLSDGMPAYENVMVIHDEEVRDERGCVPALDDYVDAGGNLVLTDTGVYLLETLQSDLTGGISGDDIETLTPEFAEFDEGSKDLDHPLLDDVRPHQNEIWNIVGLGYTNQEEAPVTVVDPDAFDEADGSVAGSIGEQVGVGTLGASPTEQGPGIQIIAGVLPPATQEHLHPFGLLDYGIEVLGHTIIVNSLGYDQRRIVDGEATDEWRDARYW